jgi:addiction module RelB/DinJ family antitoxin
MDMMTKVQANYRLDSDQKQAAESVLHRIGLKPTDAVNMLMHHIAMYGELPFKPSVPNAETLKAFKDTDAKIGLTKYEKVGDIFADLEE